MNLVPGTGSYNAKVMFVGEAPGAEEVLQGKPFVGRSGKLLTSLMEEVGIPRSQCYITNCVKFRPPKNRDPQNHELVQFKLWLDGEIFAIRPKLVVAVGRIAMKTLLPKLENSAITKCRGKIYSVSKFYSVMPILHPSYALRVPDAKTLIKSDLKKVLAYVRDFERPSAS